MSIAQRNPAALDTAQGLYRKFSVSRTDGSDAPGLKHFGCEYFVLDLRHDVFAAPALQAYAQACRHTHPQLAADLVARISNPEQSQPHQEHVA